MKIYTKTGDQGETSLFAGGRVSKNHPRVAAYGDVDELNAALGVARAETGGVGIDALLGEIQHDLFSLGAELATPDPAKRGGSGIRESRVDALERAIDEFESRLTPLREFILPAGCRLAAMLHLARTICRRAERSLVTLARSEGESLDLRTLRYLNRLSDLLFVLARIANRDAGVDDAPWRKPD